MTAIKPMKMPKRMSVPIRVYSESRPLVPGLKKLYFSNNGAMLLLLYVALELLDKARLWSDRLRSAWNPSRTGRSRS